MQANDNTYPRPSAQLAVMALEKFGVRDVVLSPGTRNAPLILACNASRALRKHLIVDERSAAFFALGLAACSQKPVALVCSSGSAMLNYAPALAEAYYRQIPLITLTADRPEEWIDQADSQTIRQPGALSAVVKKSVTVPDFDVDDIEQKEFAGRLIADAFSCALKSPSRPVHLNFPFHLPLGPVFPSIGVCRLPDTICQPPHLSNAQLKELAQRCIGKSILFVCGSMPPNHRINKALNRLSSVAGVVILAEATANLHGEHIINNTDATLAFLPEGSSPDIVIVCGGALVSGQLKSYLRGLKECDQWYIGPYADTLQDTFRRLTLSIESEPDKFFPGFTSFLSRNRGDNELKSFALSWAQASKKGEEHYASFSSRAKWSELKALASIFPQIPDSWNLHLSNGTAIRYALLHGRHRLHSIVCNRGVSGIEGSTSTAVGAAYAYSKPTLLITGDMSFSYDIAALAIKEIPKNFKVIVLSNSGGGIFRVISKTAHLPQREELFCMEPKLPLESLANAYGFRFFRAINEDELMNCLTGFLGDDSSPAILELKVDSETSAEMFRKYYTFK